VFFKFSLFKVEGDSMSPSIPRSSFVVIKSTEMLKIQNFFVFNHSHYGKLIKKLVRIDSKNMLWFEGEFKQSISVNDIGPIKKDQVIGKVILSVSKKSFKFYF
tara:strand:+ start:503 stop:811 length:309 start_codon:yes stop_codon:yes gene_type:complete